MGRKSKQTGGNLPLTNYERTKKYKTSSSETVASFSQYKLGYCALSSQSLLDSGSVLCSPSGYLYNEAALVEYLLRQTQDLKRQKVEYEANEKRNEETQKATESRKRIHDFETSQSMVKKSKIEVRDTARALKNVSYWLDTPDLGDKGTSVKVKPPDRPGSPTTGNEVRRKDFWKVELRQNKDHQLVCALSDKPLQMSNAVAYWTSDDTGVVASEAVWDQLTTDKKRRCPLTDERIRKVRPLVGTRGTAVQRVEGLCMT